MDTADILELAGQGGFALVLLGAFVWLVRTVGLALVAEIRGMRGDLSEHTKLDLEHHGRVHNAIAELNGKLDGIAYERERTPVGVDPPRPPRARSEPGLYGPQRGKRNE